MNEFISCDWGTSRLRLRLVERQNQRILREHVTDEGVLKLAAVHGNPSERNDAIGNAFARGLDALGIAQCVDVPAVISGMASSTLGWQSLPYAELPAPIDGSTFRYADFVYAGRQVRLVSGLKAEHDVMRGEETELVGIFAMSDFNPLADHCLVVLPGSHSKHVQVRDGRIVNFRTYLTGELYGLLCQNSTLETSRDGEFDGGAFLEGVHTAKSLGLSAALFQTRARVVIGRLSPIHSRAFLSGVLIGGELAALQGFPARHVVLAAAEPLAGQYALALRELLPRVALSQVPPHDLAAVTAAGHARLLARR